MLGAPKKNPEPVRFGIEGPIVAMGRPGRRVQTLATRDSAIKNEKRIAKYTPIRCICCFRQSRLRNLG
jgi:hypothetical protein